MRLRFRGVWQNLRWHRFLEKRSVFSRAPFKLSLYESLLRRCRERDYLLPEFDAENLKKGSPKIFVRHDLDTVDCLANMHLLSEINVMYKVPAAVFVRTDSLDYSLDLLSTFATQLKAHKNRLGLHTSCYLAGNDWINSLKKEVASFQHVFGFAPKWLTVHGLGMTMLEYRQELIESIGTNPYLSGHELFLDAHPRNRNYTYVIQDCWKDAEKGERFIYSDFKDLPPFRGGTENLILTHPCYWTQ